MENRRGIFSHLSGIIRLVVFIILIILLVFFVIRFVRNRQASNRAEEAIKTAQQDEKQKSTDTNKNKSNSEPNQTEEPDQLPSGVAESDLPEPQTVGSTGLPAAGMTEDVLLTTATLGLLAYAVTRFTSTKATLKQLQ